MRKYIRSVFDRYFGNLATKSDLREMYAQIAALLEIKDIIGREVRLGPLRGWALSPDALHTILTEILYRNSPRVIEFGAGESTLALAACLQKLGGGSLVTIEHDEHYASEIARRLDLNDLSDFSQIKLTPIRDYGPYLGLPGFASYDLQAIEYSFDVAVIDGPIVHKFGAASRLIPLKWCVDRLNERGVIYVDDAARPSDNNALNAFCSSHPHLDARLLETEKGLMKFSVPLAHTPERTTP